MTWSYRTTISDDLHRLENDQGDMAWGVENPDIDTDGRETATIHLPSGTAELLLIEPLPGGLVLDVVRAYRGLTDGEIITVFLGFLGEIEELPPPSAGRTYLCLECIGLDAEGRPRIIPGITRPLSASIRTTLGELIYHAGSGTSWTSTLLPINIAMKSCSAQMRALVTDLLDDSEATAAGPLGLIPHPGELQRAIAEVVAGLREVGTPCPLPLLPVDHELDPGLALTARLRMGNMVEGLRGQTVPPGSVRSESEERIPADDIGASAGRPRKDSRRMPWARGTGSRPRGARHAQHARPSSLRALRRLITRPRAALGAAAVTVALLGAGIAATAWSTATEPQERQAPAAPASQGPAAQGSGAPNDDRTLAEATRIVEDLCTERALALSQGDAAGLRMLTVPESSAAMADELIDLAAFEDTEYRIDLDSVQVREFGDSTIVVGARMTSAATADGQTREFDPQWVEIEVARHEGAWKVAEVREQTETSSAP